jgi:hypothetical protein
MKPRSLIHPTQAANTLTANSPMLQVLDRVSDAEMKYRIRCWMKCRMSYQMENCIVNSPCDTQITY